MPHCFAIGSLRQQPKTYDKRKACLSELLQVYRKSHGLRACRANSLEASGAFLKLAG
jgi:hypothetical protein